MAEAYWTDLRYRPLDKKGDMIIGGLDTALQGLDAMTQLLKTRLQALWDVWWEEDEETSPLFSLLGLPRTEENRVQLELLLVECVEDTIGVLSIQNVKSEYGQGRSFLFSCDVQTVYGMTKAEVSV